MQIEQFTYRDLTKTKTRNEMLSNGVSSLGTQAGGFGIFNEQARVLTLSGAKKIKSELSKLGNLKEILEECPVLNSLIK